MNQRTRKTLAFVLLAAFSCNAVAQQSNQRPVAAVNGQTISEEELLAAAAPELAALDARQSQFDLEMKRDREGALQRALESLFRDRVLAAEAAKRKVSVEELLEAEVSRVVPAPTDEAVASVLDAFVERLKNSYGAVSLTEPLRLSIPTTGRPSKGPDNAPVTLVEFSDFECPFCRELFPTLQRIAANYKDTVRIVYLQFPLADLHPHALGAAEASLCAHDQGKFWPMHDALFADPQNLKPEDLTNKASALTLDMPRFNACLDGGTNFARVRDDVSEGVKAGVEGTPALFINGRPLLGNRPYSEIQKVIEDELRRVARAKL